MSSFMIVTDHHMYVYISLECEITTIDMGGYVAGVRKR